MESNHEKRRWKNRVLTPFQKSIHFLTGDDPYPTYLYRMNFTENDRCECVDVEASEHMLFCCHLTRSRKSFVKQNVTRWSAITYSWTLWISRY